MFRSLTVKVTLALVVMMWGIGAIFAYTLYVHVLAQQEEATLADLQYRAKAHQQILQLHNDELTRQHVIAMEHYSNRSVTFSDGRQEGWVQRDLAKRTVAYAVPIGQQSLILTLKTTEWQTMKSNTNHLIIGLFTGYSGAALLFIVWLSRFIRRPLKQLVVATEAVLTAEEVSLPTERDDEIGQLARTLARVTRELAVMKQLRSTFLATLAHELRTPLTYLKGYAHFAKRATDDGEREPYLTIIEEEAVRLNELVEQLTAFAKREEMVATLQREALPLHDVLAEWIVPFQLSATAQQMEWHVQLERCVLVTDRRKLQQIIFNLLDNALRFTPPNGQLHIRLTETERTVTIEIADSGPGLTVDAVTITQPFYSETVGHAGLGLAICQQFIDLLDGTMSFHQQEPHGLRVKLQFEKEGASCTY